MLIPNSVSTFSSRANSFLLASKVLLKCPNDMTISQKQSIWGVIPARLESHRLPGKLLMAETGRPLIQHTWEQACQSRLLDQLLIATDSPQIAEVVRGFGAQCEMTARHTCGTDRIADVVRRSTTGVDIVVNIQGDEPELEASHIDQLVTALLSEPTLEMSTLAVPIQLDSEFDSPSCVKVVCTERGRALYFSRAPIPFQRDPGQRPEPGQRLRHIGLYAYRRDFLLRFAATPPTAIELREGLEQLRALDMGARVHVEIVDEARIGIDTPHDYSEFVSRYKAGRGK